MEWSDEELSDVMSRGSSAAPTGIRVPALPASTLNAMMTRAVELVAARGGTMTAGGLKRALADIDERAPASMTDPLRQHIAAQGARIAVLEAELALARKGFDSGSPAEATIKTLEQQVKSIHRRSLEAGNLERLISEHGLPAAMRWVVDGKVLGHTDRKQHEEFDDDEEMVSCDECEARRPLSQMRSIEEGGWVCNDHCTRPHSCKNCEGIAPASCLFNPERVKERSEAVSANDGHPDALPEGPLEVVDPAFIAGYERGAEAMRAACWEAAQAKLRENGFDDSDEVWDVIKAAIEGATP